MSLRGKVKQGRVLSDKMQKTVVVQVESLKRHPLYDKVIRDRKNHKAHCETGECQIGDLVEVEETRPLSKDKRWRVTRVLRKAGVIFSEAKVG